MPASIYDYGHWDETGLRFVMDAPQITRAIDEDGVHDQEFRMIDFSQVPLPADFGREEMDAMVAAFIDPDSVSFPASPDDLI